MDAKCPGTTVSRAQFLALAEDVPLILAPAALTWATFERASMPLPQTAMHAG